MRLCGQAHSVVHILLVVALCVGSSTSQQQYSEHAGNCKESADKDTTALLQSYKGWRSKNAADSSYSGTRKADEQVSGFAAQMGSKVFMLTAQVCDQLNVDCRGEKTTILAIGGSLIAAIIFVLIVSCSLTEDKDQHVTPLCPRLLAGPQGLNFQMTFDSKDADIEEFEVINTDDAEIVLAHVNVKWLDTAQSTSTKLIAIARLHSPGGVRLGSVVARNVQNAGAGVAICRPHSEEMFSSGFAFVVPDSREGRYKVMHRTGQNLLNLTYDLDKSEICGVNLMGIVEFHAKIEDGICRARVASEVDAGLVLCCVLGVRLHQGIAAMAAKAKASGSDPFIQDAPAQSQPSNSIGPPAGPSGAASTTSRASSSSPAST